MERYYVLVISGISVKYWFFHTFNMYIICMLECISEACLNICKYTL